VFVDVNEFRVLFFTFVIQTVCNSDIVRYRIRIGHGMNNDHTFYAEVGNRIKRARETLGITQDALASLVSLSRTSITNIEKGRQKLLLHKFVDLVAALQVMPDELLPERNTQLQQALDELLKDHPVKEREWVKSAITSPKKRR